MLSLTKHARFEMEKRGITEAMVAEVTGKPQQKIKVDENREIWQNKIELGGKTYILRVVVETQPLKVVTVYKSSKIEKYWRGVQ